ncbi:MAG: 4Fe-4S binding protein [Myxococcota bacterium]
MYAQGQNGLLSTYREGWRNRNPLGIAISLALILFYLILYFETNLGITWLTDLAIAMKLGGAAYENDGQTWSAKWYLYGFLYCIAMVGGGIYYLRRHGNSRYNKFRIAVNIFVQILMGFTLPFVMPFFGGKEFYFSYFWPLKFDYFYPQTLADAPLYLAIYTLAGSILAVPILAVFFGKRWYCSWVCGCGGLANTFGDPWRHLTSKSTGAWRFEQITVHSVMFIALVATALIGIDYIIGDNESTFHIIVSGKEWDDFSVKYMYGLVVGSILAGVVGTGFYPLFGPRVWCRNFCPMAALLGWFQKLGRFRIRVKPDMCISCGNCSTYCEMGIDVRAYAQNNESFTRAACVGCGMCAHMCPRGVLKLENGWKLQDDKKRQHLPVVNF